MRQTIVDRTNERQLVWKSHILRMVIQKYCKLHFTKQKKSMMEKNNVANRNSRSNVVTRKETSKMNEMREGTIVLCPRFDKSQLRCCAHLDSPCI